MRGRKTPPYDHDCCCRSHSERWKNYTHTTRKNFRTSLERKFKFMKIWSSWRKLFSFSTFFLVKKYVKATQQNKIYSRNEELRRRVMNILKNYIQQHVWAFFCGKRLNCWCEQKEKKHQHQLDTLWIYGRNFRSCFFVVRVRVVEHIEAAKI